MFLEILLGWFLADLVGGFYHWMIDHHLSPTNPLWGKVVRDFNEHHDNRQSMDKYSRWPSFFAGMIWMGPFAAVACYFGFYYLAATMFTGAAFTQHVHRWAHTPKIPRLVQVCQQLGIFVSPEAHERHHSDFNRSYGVLNGWSQGLQDLLLGRLYA